MALGFWLGHWHAERAQRANRELGDHIADRATVIAAVRQLARLETVSYHMEQVVDLKNHQSRLFGLVQAEDAILLVAAGDVIAGIDLGAPGAVELRVEAEQSRASLTLPAPVVLSARLDNERTYVQHRNTDLLAKRVDAIETRARQHAEREIRRAALDAGILEEARGNATQTLAALVRSFGYAKVEVHFRPSSH